ncbi:hypothetical protein PIB30_072716 [Stylosanthes scabra]|uniref:Uncharacterized protein n=1 Tax=Stylosanthes scabra TaxID=79078 RepID=A0ABU6QPT7_9FABA|nr:hypothetical protein [Stylosanthes scabra]
MIGVEVAKEGMRNEEITKKSLEANSDAYAYAPMVACRVVTLCLGHGLKCADDLSCWSLKATDGRNRDLRIGTNSTTRPFDSSGLLPLGDSPSKLGLAVIIGMHNTSFHGRALFYHSCNLVLSALCSHNSTATRTFSQPKANFNFQLLGRTTRVYYSVFLTGCIL